MLFTPDQIQFIETLVDERLRGRAPAVPAPPPKPYHTVGEIRGLVMAHLDEMRDWLGDEEFDISVLRHFLARKTVLREQDLVESDSGTRWARQVTNALQGQWWPECPVEPGRRRAHYRFKTANHSQLSI